MLTKLTNFTNYTNYTLIILLTLLTVLTILVEYLAAAPRQAAALRDRRFWPEGEACLRAGAVAAPGGRRPGRRGSLTASSGLLAQAG